MADIRLGDFIKVNSDADFRAGHDGMIVALPDEDGEVGMVFDADRYGESVGRVCVGIEAWNVSELDMTTLER